MIAQVIGDLLAGLVRANVAAAPAVLLVVLLRVPVRRWFGARAAYGLWWLPLLAAVAVLIPHPQIAMPTVPLAPIVAAVADEVVASAPAQASGPDAMGLAFAAWIAGCVLTAGVLARRQAAFLGSLGRLEKVAGRLFRAERSGVGPAVVGVFRPRIVAPADFETRYAPAERELILAHETAHVRAGDAAVNALLCAAQCLAWFNPLAHVAARLLRVDQELACDAAVIGAFPGERKTYAELLLKTQLFTQALPLGCHWPAGAEHPLKARIAMLRSPLPGRGRRVAGVALVAGLSASGAAGAWATGVGPGAAERLAAEAAAALHPSYSCDPGGEARGEGCRIVRVQTWLAVPTRADLLRHYPPAARKAGLTADVRITCGMTANGLLKDCAPAEILVTAPAGVAVGDDSRAAFGKAAVALSRYYQFRVPETPRAVAPKGAHAGLRIVFTPDGSASGVMPPPPGAVPARPMPPLPMPAAGPPTSG